MIRGRTALGFLISSSGPFVVTEAIHRLPAPDHLVACHGLCLKDPYCSTEGTRYITFPPVYPFFIGIFPFIAPVSLPSPMLARALSRLIYLHRNTEKSWPFRTAKSHPVFGITKLGNLIYIYATQSYANPLGKLNALIILR